MCQEGHNPFLDKAGEFTLISRPGGEKGSDQVVPGNSVFLSSEMGMLGNFLSCIKGVKYHFEFQEGMWDLF